MPPAPISPCNPPKHIELGRTDFFLRPTALYIILVSKFRPMQPTTARTAFSIAHMHEAESDPRCGWLGLALTRLLVSQTSTFAD